MSNETKENRQFPLQAAVILLFTSHAVMLRGMIDIWKQDVGPLLVRALDIQRCPNTCICQERGVIVLSTIILRIVEPERLPSVAVPIVRIRVRGITSQNPESAVATIAIVSRKCAVMTAARGWLSIRISRDLLAVTIVPVSRYTACNADMITTA